MTNKSKIGAAVGGAIAAGALLTSLVLAPPPAKLSVSLAWDLPNNPPLAQLAGVRVYTAEDDGPWIQTNTIPLTNIVTVTGLATNKIYRFGLYGLTTDDREFPLARDLKFGNPQLLYLTATSNAVKLTFFCYASNQFRLYGTSNLSDWNILLTGIGSSQMIEFTEPLTNQKFYRLK